MNRINIIAKYIKNGTILRITKFKHGMRGTLFDANGKKICSAVFYEKDRDNTIYRVKEYFGFNDGSTCLIYTKLLKK